VNRGDLDTDSYSRSNGEGHPKGAFRPDPTIYTRLHFHFNVVGVWKAVLIHLLRLLDWTRTKRNTTDRLREVQGFYQQQEERAPAHES
jgi:hypothetical protein